MKQIVQNYRSGALFTAEVPAPALRSGGLLVATRASLISAGTERMKVEVARKNLIGKALERPDQVKKVVESVRQQGLLPTYQKVMNRLDTLTPLGYSSAGEVLEVGREVSGYQVGDRVACAGAGYAVHAEIVSVPYALTVRMRPDTSYERGSFTTLGAIALQGVRQGEIRLGEDVVVIGLGLVGLITVQLLACAGARVIGVELDPERAALARTLGCERVIVGGEAEVKEGVRAATGGRGADCVLVTAASSSSAPVALAGEVCRDRGRVVVVGITRMDLPHRVFYEKELSLLLSRSYGPGRYDPSYEEGGVDYPIGYVRWTERRNMEEFLRLIEDRRVDVDVLTSHRVPFAEADGAYDLLTGKRAGSYLGIVLTYPEEATEAARTARVPTAGPGVNGRAASAGQTGAFRRASRAPASPLGVGFLGAGNFATSMLLPHLKSRGDVRLTGVVTPSGLSAKNAADKFGFAFCASDAQELFADEATDAVFVVTRHHLHSPLAEKALAAGLSVFVEKPLATTPEQLDSLQHAVQQAIAGGARAPVFVGFNRRFAPLSKKLLAHVKDRGPLAVQIRVNAGFLGKDSWYQDPQQGGGRILGEVCHFLDYVHFLSGAPIRRVHASGLRDPRGHYRADDNLAVTVECADGSLGSILYSAAGDPAMPKERIEVLGQGRSAVLDNFRELTTWTDSRRHSEKALGIDKGHAAEIAAWVEALRAGTAAPIAWESLVNVARATFATMESLATGESVPVA